MLIKNVPESLNIQNPDNAGHLEKQDRCRFADRRANGLHKPACVVNMLQRVAAGNAIGLDVAMLVGVELLDEPHARHLAAPSGHPGRINSNALVVTQLTDQPDKIAFAAANLDHLLVADIIPVDKTLRNPGDKLNKGGGKSLLVLITLGVVVNRRIKLTVEDEPAPVAERENDILSGNSQRFVTLFNCHQTLGRGIRYPEKVLQIIAATTGTLSMFHFFS